jgi:hypothetical protein
MRKQKRDDNSKQETKALRQVPLSFLLYAYCGDGQIYDEEKPESVYNPDENRHSPIIIITRWLCSSFHLMEVVCVAWIIHRTMVEEQTSPVAGNGPVP